TNRQRFYHRHLLISKPLGRYQKTNRNSYQFLHPAIGMDAQNLNVRATIGLAIATSNTFLTTYIRHYHHLITNLQSPFVFPDLNNFGSEFMSQYPWVGKESLIPRISMQIG